MSSPRSYFVIALAAVLTVNVAGAALAQDKPAPPTTPQQPTPETQWPAPVGHRQPRPTDLPPDIRRDERQGPAPQERRFDEQLENSICRKC